MLEAGRVRRATKGGSFELSRTIVDPPLVKSISSQLPEPHSPVEQLYAQVEKKGKKKRTKSTPQPEEPSSPMDQLYAQVEKKKKTTEKSAPHLDASIDQLYAQVDKKKASKKLESTSQLEEPSSSIDQLYAQVDKTNKKNARKNEGY